MPGNAGIPETICYADIKIRKFVALVMLHDGCQIFNQTSPIRKFDTPSAVAQSKGLSSHQPLQANMSVDHLFLADMLRISLCFEIFFRATLLLRGYVIHKIDTFLDKTLSSKQLQQPIKISEISNDVFKNLNVETIGWDILLAHEYKNHLRMPSKLFESLEKIIDLCNSVQFSMSDQKRQKEITKDDIIYIRMYYREILIRFYEDLLSQHEDFQKASVGMQLTLMGRAEPIGVLRRFYTKLTGKRR